MTLYITHNFPSISTGDIMDDKLHTISVGTDAESGRKSVHRWDYAICFVDNCEDLNPSDTPVCDLPVSLNGGDKLDIRISQRRWAQRLQLDLLWHHWVQDKEIIQQPGCWILSQRKCSYWCKFHICQLDSKYCFSPKCILLHLALVSDKNTSFIYFIKSILQYCYIPKIMA